MPYTTTVIIGADQSGLAIGYELTLRGIDHVILEGGEVANAWTSDRWESLRLLTPNWQSRLPGGAYQGQDPDGFASTAELAARLAGYARRNALPVRTGIAMRSATQGPRGFRVHIQDGPWDCAHVVAANGACARPAIPKGAAGLPSDLPSFSTFDYKRPSDLPEGGVLVVGGSATGLRLARELRLSGRRVILSVGEHVRVRRRYRGRDVMWWMNACGLMDIRLEDVDDPVRVRRSPSLQLAAGSETLDLNSVQRDGVEVVGRLSMIRDGQALFSGGLSNTAPWPTKSWRGCSIPSMRARWFWVSRRRRKSVLRARAWPTIRGSCWR